MIRRSLEIYLERQKVWSSATFGTGKRTESICRHIETELAEIRQNPDDLMEWIDVIILAMDGFWRHGGEPINLLFMLNEKQRLNFARQWPPVQAEDQPTEHVK